MSRPQKPAGDWRFAEARSYQLPAATPPGALQVWLDVPVTRRQTLHQVFGQGDQLVFTAKTFSDVLQWLIDREERTLVIATPLGVYLASVEELPQPKEP